MRCPSCQADNDDAAEVCFTCGRAVDALVRGSLVAGRYEVLTPLGRGGMGAVYKAHDRMLDETVAIKVLLATFGSTADLAARFRFEIKMARRVSHRNVCRIHEYGEHEGVRYISMEYVEGKDLKQLAEERGGFLPPLEALDLAIQAADGLQAIHDVGIVHRDLKATNIMVDARGTVRVMDFGIAKIGDRQYVKERPLTTSGQVMGTPEYMSPEQCCGEPLDQRSDIYSLGIVLYETMTGVLPFLGETPVATLYMQVEQPVSFAGTAGQRVPPEAVALLRKALAKDRGERFATAAGMAEAMRWACREIDPAAVDSGSFAAFTLVDDPGLAPPEAAEAEGEAAPGRSDEDRRRVTRLDIFVNFILRRVGTLGTVLQEERTIAENIGRLGARVVTSMSLAPGDVVQLEEVGGRFKTRAEVRGIHVGRDRVRRLNVRFLDAEAPAYLVHVDGTR